MTPPLFAEHWDTPIFLFGVNVAKVMQILAYDESKHTIVPNENKAILGVLLWQKNTIPLIDLNIALNKKMLAGN